MSCVLVVIALGLLAPSQTAMWVWLVRIVRTLPAYERAIYDARDDVVGVAGAVRANLEARVTDLESEVARIQARRRA